MSHRGPGPDCLDEDRITGFLARTLTVEQRHAVEVHIDVCDDCRGLLAELAQLLASPAEPTIGHTATQAVSRRSGHARGETIGRFVILDVLGVGGMGVVHAAYDPELDRKVAVKLLHPTQAPRDAAAGGPARLLHEAQAMARLHHEHVITVYEVDTLGEDVFLAMELVEGVNVRQWLLGEHPGWRAVVQVFVRAGRGLAAAHTSGIVHRDFKPDNVLIGRDGRVKVTDFGLAAPGPTSGDVSPVIGDAAWLVTGTVAGTPAYMAPEQFAGRIVDARSDQFSFCVALYEALCGARPFAGDSYTALAEAVAAGRISPGPGERRVPGWLRRWVLRGLAVAPEQRHASMTALLTGLERGLRRRRQGLMATGAAGLAVVAALVGGLGLAGAPEPVCTGAEARLAEVWGQGQRDAVRTSFLAVDKPYAEDAWLGVDRALTEYTAGWNQAHVRACEATHVRKEESQQQLDLRMMCLDDRLAELEALVAIFRGADAAVVERAVQAARSLSSFRACEGRASGLANLAPPADAEVARQVADLRHALATVRATHDAGRYTAARAEAEGVRGQAATIGFRPLLGEALLALGRAQEQAGEHAQARTSYEEAALIAEAGRDDDTRARALIRLIETVGVGLALREEVASVVRTAGAVVERIGDDRELRGLLHLAVGHLRRFEARYDEAMVEFEAARADLQATRGDDDPIGADLLMAMGGALGSRQTRYEDALAMYGRALEQRRRLLGPAHPDVGRSLASIATVRAWQGKTDEALALDREALAILEPALGSVHPMVATVLGNMAHLHMIRGEFPDALSTGRRVLAVREQTMGPDHPEVAQSLFNLANTLLSVDDYDEGLRLHERALAIRIAKLGPGHPRTGWSHASVGISHMVRNDLEAAERSIREALAIQVAATGAESMDVFATSYVLGDVLIAQKRWRDAAAAYGRGLELAPGLLEPDHPDVAYPLTGLGRCHLELGRPGEALELLERALEIRRSFKGIPAELADTLFPLARARVAAGRDRSEAIVLAEEAAELYGRSKSGFNVVNRDEVLRWIAAQR